MKYSSKIVAVTTTFLIAATFAQDGEIECDLAFCAEPQDIWVLDRDACDCFPIDWMECHPRYQSDYTDWGTCDQAEYDAEQGRDPALNPYIDEDWYPGGSEAPDSAVKLVYMTIGSSLLLM